jgi:hypothetical protein
MVVYAPCLHLGLPLHNNTVNFMHSYQQGETMDIEFLDVCPEMSLFVEAVRGGSNE